jgi:hypothetical protein
MLKLIKKIAKKVSLKRKKNRRWNFFKKQKEKEKDLT